MILKPSNSVFTQCLLVFHSFLCLTNAEDTVWSKCSDYGAANGSASSNETALCLSSDGNSSSYCSAIANKTECLNAVSNLVNTPGAQLQQLTDTSFVFDWKQNMLCVRPKAKVGESLGSMLGYSFDVHLINDDPRYEYLVHIGCVFNTSLTRTLLNDTFCCNLIPRDWLVTGKTQVQATAHSLPYAIGQERLESDYIPMSSLTRPPFSDPNYDHTYKNEADNSNKFWIRVAIIIGVILAIALAVGFSIICRRTHAPSRIRDACGNASITIQDLCCVDMRTADAIHPRNGQNVPMNVMNQVAIPNADGDENNALLSTRTENPASRLLSTCQRLPVEQEQSRPSTSTDRQNERYTPELGGRAESIAQEQFPSSSRSILEQTQTIAADAQTPSAIAGTHQSEKTTIQESQV